MALPSIFTPLRPSPAAPDTPDRLPLEQIRHQLHQALHDCRSIDAQRIIYRINMAGTPADLWLLRSDLYQCIARARDQTDRAVQGRRARYVHRARTRPDRSRQAHQRPDGHFQRLGACCPTHPDLANVPAPRGKLGQKIQKGAGPRRHELAGGQGRINRETAKNPVW